MPLPAIAAGALRIGSMIGRGGGLLRKAVLKKFVGGAIAHSNHFIGVTIPASIGNRRAYTLIERDPGPPAISYSYDSSPNNEVHIMPKTNLNNNSGTTLDPDDTSDIPQGTISFELSDDEIAASFGKSIDISRNSPTLADSSASNPIFLAITSKYKPINSGSEWFNTVDTDWSKQTSVTKIIGIYEENGTVHKHGINLKETGSSSTKTPATATEFNKYKGSWQYINCNVDTEPIIDYGKKSGLNSKTQYGTKVRLSITADRCAISNHRDPDSEVGHGLEDKPGEVKILIRQDIVINYNSQTINWFEYENIQNITIPDDHIITGSGRLDFGYDIALEGDFLAISSPSEKTVFIYKWNNSSISYEYWNKIYMEEPEVFGKAVVFDTRDSGDPTTITISANDAFFTMPIPSKL